MISIDSWNINENIEWFVRVSDNGSGLDIELYLSQANATARSNLQADGTTSGYGTNLEVTLTNQPGATDPVSLFRTDNAWHLLVSGQSGDATKIYQIKEFVEMDEISHAIYKNSNLITLRATYEIDMHTFAKITRTTALSDHIPTLEVGSIVKLNSSRRGINDLGQVSEFEISGNLNSIVNDQINIDKFMELKR